MIEQSITEYNHSQADEWKAICQTLAEQIDSHLAGATSKVWHAAPVWFIDDNPIVGYWVRKGYVQLLFWSGQSFDEPGLTPEGKFKAAEVRYQHVDDINVEDLTRWLTLATKIQWDYKNIVKRRGELVLLGDGAGS